MKTYIKAAYDPSKPEWLDFKSPAAKHVRSLLEGDFALSQAKFYDEPQPDSIPIYLLYETYETDRWERDNKSYVGEVVYIPHYGSFAYDDVWVEAGERYRHLNTVAKAKFDQHVVDVTYMVAPKKSDIKQGRGYIDDRYTPSGDRHKKWKYMGQYQTKESVRNPETGAYENKLVWKSRDNTYYGPKYDKSGYLLHSPAELHAKLLEKYPNRLKHSIENATKILEEYYNKIRKARYKIFNAYDIKHGRTADTYGYGSAFGELNNAVGHYGVMYRKISEAIEHPDELDQKDFAAFVSGSGYGESLPALTDSIDRCIENIEHRLKMWRT